MDKAQDFGEKWPMPPIGEVGDFYRWVGRYRDDGRFYWEVEDRELRRAVACVNSLADIPTDKLGEVKKAWVAMQILALCAFPEDITRSCLRIGKIVIWIRDFKSDTIIVAARELIADGATGEIVELIKLLEEK